MSLSLVIPRTLLPVMMAASALFLAAAGCNNPPDQADQARADPFEKELMDADRRFAREVNAASADERGRVWAAWFSPEGRQIIPGQVVEGTRSIVDLMGPAFASGRFILTWEPDLASSSAAGDLGWTSGRYENLGGDGSSVQAGRYLTVWRRQADGTWKVALDTGVPDPGE